MDLVSFENLLLNAPLASASLLLLAALLLAEMGVRFVRLPRIPALVAAGALYALLRAQMPQAQELLLPQELLDALAMVLLFEVGQRVPLTWLRRNPALALTSLAEFFVTVVLVYVVLVYVIGLGAVASAMVAAVCGAASPIVIMSVSRELGARGQTAERALLFSALSSVYAVLAVNLFQVGFMATQSMDLGLVMAPVRLLSGSLLIGFIAALALMAFLALTAARGPVLTIAVLAISVLLYLAAHELALSPMLAALSFGLLARGLDRDRRLAHYEMSEAANVLTLAFFILVGATLEFSADWAVYGAAALVVLVRQAAKVGVNAGLAPLAALGARKGALVGLACAPMSGVALMLASRVAGQDGMADAGALIFIVVMLLALVGPVLTEMALHLARENTRSVR